MWDYWAFPTMLRFLFKSNYDDHIRTGRSNQSNQGLHLADAVAFKLAIQLPHYLNLMVIGDHRGWTGYRDRTEWVLYFKMQTLDITSTLYRHLLEHHTLAGNDKWVNPYCLECVWPNLVKLCMLVELFSIFSGTYGNYSFLLGLVYFTVDGMF